jgi:hypothetical protein
MVFCVDSHRAFVCYHHCYNVEDKKKSCSTAAVCREVWGRFCRLLVSTVGSLCLLFVNDLWSVCTGLLIP